MVAAVASRRRETLKQYTTTAKSSKPPKGKNSDVRDTIELSDDYREVHREALGVVNRAGQPAIKQKDSKSVVTGLGQRDDGLSLGPNGDVTLPMPTAVDVGDRGDGLWLAHPDANGQWSVGLFGRVPGLPGLDGWASE